MRVCVHQACFGRSLNEIKQIIHNIGGYRANFQIKFNIEFSSFIKGGRGKEIINQKSCVLS